MTVYYEIHPFYNRAIYLLFHGSRAIKKVFPDAATFSAFIYASQAFIFFFKKYEGTEEKKNKMFKMKNK